MKRVITLSVVIGLSVVAIRRIHRVWKEDFTQTHNSPTTRSDGAYRGYDWEAPRSPRVGAIGPH